eukprot:1702883-Alexandrium_andersonii.AAC.1
MWARQDAMHANEEQAASPCTPHGAEQGGSSGVADEPFILLRCSVSGTTCRLYEWPVRGTK